MFQLQQFTIDQTNVSQKVGTDSMLLGAWANATGNHALDIGCGTGILSLMLAQRNSHLQINAVEIDDRSVLSTTRNFSASTWVDRLAVHAMSIQQFSAQSNQKYDCIISNPPYFEGSLLADDEQRKQARHTLS